MALKTRRKTGRYGYAVIRAYGTKELRPDDLKWILIICDKYEIWSECIAKHAGFATKTWGPSILNQGLHWFERPEHEHVPTKNQHLIIENLRHQWPGTSCHVHVPPF